MCKKVKAESVSIPYKYVVYKKKKEKYEFEYIYKLDSNETTNRCLFVKPHLLNVEGKWNLPLATVAAKLASSTGQYLERLVQLFIIYPCKSYR